MRQLDLSSLNSEAAAALERMFTLYGDGMYKWMARLWEPEIGGFYYSNSARDYEGFLPDVESTAQAIHALKNNGLFEKYSGDFRLAIPEDIQAKVVEYTRSLQDPDGFFYHPQWGKDIPIMRRGRDYGWAMGLLKMFGGKPAYTPAAEQIEGGNTDAIAPNLRSVEAFSDFLYKKYDRDKYFNHLAHVIQAQVSEIVAGGLLPMCIEFLEAEQCRETGLWGKGRNYNAVTALMKLTLFYKTVKQHMSYTDRALDSCIEVILSDEEDKRLVDITNPWVAMINLVDMHRAAGEDGIADAMVKKIRESAGPLLDKTREKLQRYSQEGQTFSFLPYYTNYESQLVLVALKEEAEGDVNATVIACGNLKRIMTLLGVPNPEIYGDEEYRDFLDILKKQKAPVKKPHPVGR